MNDAVDHLIFLATLRTCAYALPLMHTVFINDVPLHFINAYDKKEIESAKGHVVFSEEDKTIEELIHEMEDETGCSETFYLSESADVAWKIFISYCRLIEAAGGLVQNKKKEFLLIFRHRKWDLPKGKLEYDETPEQAALREVEEECGIDQLSIVKKLPQTFHVYNMKGKRMLKKNHWFLMQTESSAPLVPQVEEDIDEATWMDKNTIDKEVFANMHASIAALLQSFFGSA